MTQKKYRHSNGWYEGCYYDQDSKTWMVREQLPLKTVLDGWWNNVRVLDKNGDYHNCFKNAYTCDGTYELDGLPKSALKKTVQVADYWDEDCDGCPIVSVEIID